MTARLTADVDSVAEVVLAAATGADVADVVVAVGSTREALRLQTRDQATSQPQLEATLDLCVVVPDIPF